MLLLYQSNRLEQLGQLFCGMSQSLPLSDPFAPETVIVQSRGMGRWITLIWRAAMASPPIWTLCCRPLSPGG